MPPSIWDDRDGGRNDFGGRGNDNFGGGRGNFGGRDNDNFGGGGGRGGSDGGFGRNDNIDLLRLLSQQLNRGGNDNNYGGNRSYGGNSGSGGGSNSGSVGGGSKEIQVSCRCLFLNHLARKYCLSFDFGWSKGPS